MSAESSSAWNQFEVIGNESDENQMIESWLNRDIDSEKSSFTDEEVKSFLAELAIGGHSFSL